MKHSEYRFVTNLPSGDVMNLISKQKAEYFSDDGIVGKSYESQFEIRYQSYYRNPWTPIFYGFVSSGSNETSITGVFKVNPVIKIFMRIFQYFLFFISVIIVLSITLNGLPMLALITLFAPSLMYLIAFVMEKACIRNGENDKDEILRFIKTVLVATLDVAPNE